MSDETKPQADDKAETPKQVASRWAEELADARKKLRKFHERGRKTVRRFRDERDTDAESEKRLNLFSSNVQQVEAMLFAQVPTVDVTRRFDDTRDTVGRVAGELLGRILTEDLCHSGEDQVLAFKQALSDRLLPGLGNVRVRYDVETEQRETVAAEIHPETGEEMVPAVTEEVKTHEEAEVVYVHWQDQLWDPLARVFSECRWWAFRVYMTRTQLVDRFGEEIGRAVPLNAKRAEDDDGPAMLGTERDQAEVWECWDKERKEVCWYVEGAPAILDRQPPPMDLEGFWPFPRPMFANLTTDELVPLADYVLAQDLYREVDKMVKRRAALVDALKVAGVYDQHCTGLERLLTEGMDNQLIPVANWGAFAEKGGLQGAISWLPLEQIVSTLQGLGEQIQQRKTEIYEVTGWSDIMRGQQAENGTPGEAQVKAHFASARLNAMLEEFTRFCSDVQRLRAEVIAKYFDVATILERSNAQFTYDAETAQAAAQLIKSSLGHYRIAIKSDAVAMADYGALRAEATEVLTALGGFLQQAGGVAQAVPGSMPFLLELLRWSMSRLKGAQEIGGLLDRAIAQAQQQPPQPQGDGKSQAQTQALQMKGQQQMQAIAAKSRADMLHMQAETQQQAVRQRDQAAVNIAEAAARQKIKQGGLVPGTVPGAMP